MLSVSSSGMYKKLIGQSFLKWKQKGATLRAAPCGQKEGCESGLCASERADQARHAAVQRLDVVSILSSEGVHSVTLPAVLQNIGVVEHVVFCQNTLPGGDYFVGSLRAGDQNQRIGGHGTHRVNLLCDEAGCCQL